MNSKRINASTKDKSWVKRHPFWTILIVFIAVGVVFSVTAPEEAPASTEETVATVSSQETIKEDEKPEVPPEYRSALNKATSYASRMNMSKQGVYDQLVSEYGEQFSAEAAQYAIDNVEADWNANALAKAKSYQSRMSMSPSAIHDQLTSTYGEQFTVAEADYAIANLNQ